MMGYRSTAVTPMKRRRLARRVGLLCVVGAIVFRGYFEVIPRGASFYPYVFASVNGKDIVSPDGEVRLEVAYNDAGAAHSGNHWTWIIRRNPLTGGCVVAQGFCSPDEAIGGAGPNIAWVGKRTFIAQFHEYRYGTQTKEIRVTL
jgi:hypothetical protein